MNWAAWVLFAWFGIAAATNVSEASKPDTITRACYFNACLSLTGAFLVTQT